MEPNEKIAKILRTDKDFVSVAAERLKSAAGRDGVLERIMKENEKAMSARLKILNSSSTSAEAIYLSLIDKIRADDRKLSEHFMLRNVSTEEGSRTILNFAKELSQVGKGFFLKQERAREFILKEPPKNIIKALGYKNAEELLDKEDLFEAYSALRFMEDRDWLNNVFFKQLESVAPGDFEEREIETRALGEKWQKAAKNFVKKKYHNVSHLKELGLIFVIPEKFDVPGEVIRLLTLVLHYLHEVSFYSDLFRLYAGAAKDHTFAQKLIAALRGDVLDRRFPEEQRGRKWMIVQRYLAKDDPYDWRLFEPHVNPEAIHWSKAEEDIARLGMRFGDLGLDFWNNLDHVGDYYADAGGTEALVSFNLIDTVVSLVQEKDMIKYLYHQQEALWNRIFSEYVGRHEMEEMMVESFDKGYIHLK